MENLTTYGADLFKVIFYQIKTSIVLDIERRMQSRALIQESLLDGVTAAADGSEVPTEISNINFTADAKMQWSRAVQGRALYLSVLYFT